MEGLHEVLLMDAFINPEVIPHNVSHAFLVSVLLIVAALIVKGSLRLVPRGFQNFVEMLTEQDWQVGDSYTVECWINETTTAFKERGYSGKNV